MDFIPLRIVRLITTSFLFAFRPGGPRERLLTRCKVESDFKQDLKIMA